MSISTVLVVEYSYIYAFPNEVYKGFPPLIKDDTIAIIYTLCTESALMQLHLFRSHIMIIVVF